MTQARLKTQRDTKIPHHVTYKIEVSPPLLFGHNSPTNKTNRIITTHQPLHTISTFINCTTYGRRLRSSQHEKRKKRTGRAGRRVGISKSARRRSFPHLLVLTLPSKTHTRNSREPVVVFSISPIAFSSHTLTESISARWLK